MNAIYFLFFLFLFPFRRDFQLRLQPAEGIFSNDHKVYRDGVGIHTADTSFIYQGTVQGW